ncbi:MAG TPA: EscN/YscN/HrcN family type III secretion system ATPase [Candidatus Tumulicola sp.]
MIARGVVLGARGGFVEACLPGARVGDGVSVAATPEPAAGHVCALDAARVFIAMHAAIGGIARGTPVRSDPWVRTTALGSCALGRAIDARGRPLDGGPPLRGRRVAIAPASPSPHDRAPVREPFWTGVRVLDGLLTIGRGARVGIFGAPGVGKSTLLESIAGGCSADATVVGLIGERGREAQRWIDARDARTTVVCATSDRPAAERVRATHVAMAQAAALRARGLHVLLVLDSLARLAAALREIAVAAGESVGRGGYPPSTFAELARLVEVAGPLRAGSITLIASVIDDGEDRDPVSDAARSLLDGHVVLAPRLAEAGRFPAIDVPASASRTMALVARAPHVRAARVIRRALALLDRVEDARRLGIDPVDAPSRRAMAIEGRLEAFLRQDDGPVAAAVTLKIAGDIADCLEDSRGEHC